MFQLSLIASYYETGANTKLPQQGTAKAISNKLLRARVGQQKKFIANFLCQSKCHIRFAKE